MSETIKIAKRYVPIEHIAILEPFVAEENLLIKSERPLKTRLVLLNRESVLTEDALEAFAERHGFRMLSDEGIATNPMVAFSVESFAAQDGFAPTKPYRSRLAWKDQTGQTQSKLLLAEPEKVLAVVVRGEPESRADGKPAAKRSRRTRKQQPVPAPS